MRKNNQFLLLLSKAQIKGRRIIAIAFLSFVVTMTFASVASAGQQIAALGGLREGLNSAAEAADIKPAGDVKPLPEIIGTMINTVLGLVGILLFVYLLYGGFMWMTAGGTEDRVKKAQSVIKNAIIGIVIIALSFAIADQVLELIIGAVSNTPTTQ